MTKFFLWCFFVRCRHLLIFGVTWNNWWDCLLCLMCVYKDIEPCQEISAQQALMEKLLWTSFTKYHLLPTGSSWNASSVRNIVQGSKATKKATLLESHHLFCRSVVTFVIFKCDMSAKYICQLISLEKVPDSKKL